MGAKAKQRKSIEILIAEDSPTQAEQLKYLLEKHSFFVRVARNGEEALTLLRQYKPAVVISDIVMPRMDGYELCKQIKADEKLRSIPVILLTALSDPKDVMSGLECGADNFVTKPYNEDYLLARVQYLLANQDLLQESTRVQVGVEVIFAGRRYYITSDRLQILNLLLSTYETAVQKNKELIKMQDELRELNENLEQKVQERTAFLTLEIEERKKAESALEQSIKELEMFAYTAAHDLRAPLVTIQGFSAQLQVDLVREDLTRVKEDAKLVETGISKMQNLLSTILEYGRTRRIAEPTETIPLREIIDESIAQLSGQIRSSGANVSIVGEFPTVFVDRISIVQVFNNLILNCTQYRDKTRQPNIQIGHYLSNGEDVYFVRDNGTGISRNEQAKVFELFYRGAKESQGAGLGLKITKNIVEAYGGRIWIESEEGKGTTVCFTLGASKGQKEA